MLATKESYMTDEISTLAREFQDEVGRPVCNLAEAARLVDAHVNTLRTAIYRGDMSGSRRAPNGPILVRCRELARWVVDGERLSLPNSRQDGSECDGGSRED